MPKTQVSPPIFPRPGGRPGPWSPRPPGPKLQGPSGQRAQNPGPRAQTQDPWPRWARSPGTGPVSQRPKSQDLGPRPKVQGPRPSQAILQARCRGRSKSLGRRPHKSLLRPQSRKTVLPLSGVAGPKSEAGGNKHFHCIGLVHM